MFFDILTIPGVLDKGKAKCRSLKLFMSENMMTAARGAINGAMQPRAINAGIVAALDGGGGKGGSDDNVVVFPEVRTTLI